MRYPTPGRVGLALGLKAATRTVIGAGLFFSTPVRAEFLPSPENIALAHEQAALRDAFAGSFNNPGADGPEQLATLDAALARLDAPTKLRGFIQFLRAGALWEGKQATAARDAIEESIRLLPGYSGPLLGAVELYTYSDQPGRAADYLIRASRIDPDLASKIPDYEVMGLLGRLGFVNDQRRIRAVSERLVEIDWRGDTLSSRSSIVRSAIEARMADGDVAGAKALVGKLLSPVDARALLIQNRYSALWPDVERWAGARLEKLWPPYLAESRDNWRASKDPAGALAYARVLDAAGHDGTIIAEFLPVFADRIEADRDHDLLFLAPTLANALARQGRWADIETMYGQAARVWPLGKEANALNVAANRARHVFFGGDAAKGLQLIDAAIADAARWGDEVNGDALANMHHSRACMLHALGREDASILSRAAALTTRTPVTIATLYLCLDKPRAARDVLIRALEIESLRDGVLSYVQPSDGVPMRSEYGRTMLARHRALRSDPELLKAVAPHGRVLPFGLNAGAPAEGGTEQDWELPARSPTAPSTAAASGSRPRGKS